ncbi:MAG: hypothetical protein COT81_03660 [Candidatus Buchananbacteria bacterium CG10_big_fil_rev_8_21_14_0_10_42_9]|uniref:Uncharacterized protein n=1 Tax=Candidatus Buchananbacteria bacterium CG10_big_fil_rev_8_21_14_0_10_42_9 TaxID=1974526 RepID=A0A2H0W0N7_9BACT|nr:MAG: hypothetical protein COT81_03660 [Candidatus Buchananbacteria bacterium CG10_big_fil_rev_8_21_14_0_10_42_9]
MTDEIIILDDQGQEQVITSDHKPALPTQPSSPQSKPAGKLRLPKAPEEKVEPAPLDTLADFPIGPRDTDKKKPSAPADFVLFPDDEKDVQAKEKFVEDNRQNQLNLTEVVDKIKSQSGVSFDDPVLDNRFSNIIFSHLRGVREKLETRETLQRSQKVGGVELDDPKTQKILSLLDVAYDKLHSTIVEVKPRLDTSKIELAQEQKKRWDAPPAALVEKFNQSRAVSDSKGAVVNPKMTAPSPQPTTEPKLTAPASIAPESEKIQPQSTEKQAMPKKPVTQKTEESEAPKLEAKPDESFPASSVTPESKTSEAPQVSPEIQQMKNDVLQELSKNEAKKSKPSIFKKKAKLTGPVEELQSFDLVEFRRLSPNPNDAVQKIQDKIETLGKESFTQKLNGIKAWKSSPINQMYVNLGHESISQKRSITDIINTRESKSIPTLSEDEFKAIMDLNMKLRNH